MPAEKNLRAMSESFSDMVTFYSKYIEGEGRAVVMKLLQMTPLIPQGTPSAVLNASFDSLAALAGCMSPTARDAKATLRQAEARAITPILPRLPWLGARALLLKTAIESTGGDVRTSTLRLVNDDISYAKITSNPFSRAGTVFEAWIETSMIIVHDIDHRPPTFVIYAPEGSTPPKETKTFKILRSDRQKASATTPTTGTAGTSGTSTKTGTPLPKPK